MPLPRILLFTDAAVCARRGRGVVASVAKAFVDVDPVVAARVAVVVRHDADGDERAALTEAVAAVVKRAGARVFAHHDASLVAAFDLDGVHLKGDDDVRVARLRLPPGRLLGRSAHVDDNATLRAAVANDDVDYVTLSPIFGATSKPGDRRAPLGVDVLRRSVTPTYALGAVDVTNARACVAHGAVGVAVISAVFGAVDPRRALLDLLQVTA